MEKREIILNDKKIEYTLYRKRVKNLNLKIKPDCTVFVSANGRVTLQEIEAFLIKNANFIFSALEKFKNKKSTAFNYNDGDKLYLLGEQKVLRVIKGKNNIKLCGEEIVLSVENPADLNLKKRGIDAFYKFKCEQILGDIIKEVYLQYKNFYNIPYPKIVIKKLKSVWGNCRKNKAEIHLSTYLAKADIKCIEYVVVHEFAHLIQDNHSKNFYLIVQRFMPNYKILKKRLNQY